ncbi:hypothetical protein SLL00_13305 [Metabacillus indicus]|uniref:hypothetical protein n=1 Tax=Metabacillus indicus TaxID=246786 RepID=UPI002A04B950|nr:hypothetical protein [Metabacillus indicus]MDX8290782.1 hypothetical protein [Metabacillus indicus]
MDQLAAKAEEKLRRLSADEEIIRMYQLREKYISDQKTQMDGAKIAGKNEKAIEVALSLLKIRGMSVSEIATHTGVSLEKVKELEEEVR